MIRREESMREIWSANCIQDTASIVRFGRGVDFPVHITRVGADRMMGFATNLGRKQPGKG
jgi:hypothetical protein